MHLPLILHLSYQGFQSEKSQLFNILTISLFRKSHRTLVGSAVLMKALYLQTVFSQVQRQVFLMLPNHLLCLPFIPTPTSQLEHLVHSTCSAMVCSIPEMQHNDATECAVCGDLNQSKTSLWHAGAHPTHAFPLSPLSVLGVIHFSANLSCHPQQQTLLSAAAYSATTGAAVWMLG